MTENKKITGYHLKMIALITMLIDHIAAAVLFNIYIASFRITASMQLSEVLGDRLIVWVSENQNLVYRIYDLMRNVGRMAFPIYCFLLIEGFLHTRSVAKYVGRLALFALISEIPFDLALNQTWLEFESNNVFFTLVLGLLSVWAMSYMEKFVEGWKKKVKGLLPEWALPGIVGVFIVFFFGFLAEDVFCCDYGLGGVAAIFLMYFFRKQKEVGFAMGVLALIIFCGDMEALALFMLPLIMLYNGTRGKNMKYVFYGFYPAHLLILALLCMAIVVK